MDGGRAVHLAIAEAHQPQVHPARGAGAMLHQPGMQLSLPLGDVLEAKLKSIDPSPVLQNKEAFRCGISGVNSLG